MRIKWSTIYAIILFSAGIGKVYADTYLVQCVVNDLAGKAVSCASFTLIDPNNYHYYRETDSTGHLMFVVNYTSAVENDNENSSKDLLFGYNYCLYSSTGDIVVFDVLGRKVYTEVLTQGSHKLDIAGLLPSGKYFIKMTTPYYSAVNAVMIIDGQYAGKGKVHTVLDISPSQSGLAQKTATSCILQGIKTGYTDFEQCIVLGVDCIDYSDKIYMDRLPVAQYTMADTLWEGIDLNLFIDNDNGGYWETSNGAVQVSDGILNALVRDTVSSRIEALTLTYHDSIDPEITFTYDRMIYLGKRSASALIIVVENCNMLGGGDLESIFEYIRGTLTPVLASIFQINESDMDGMTLTEIVDVFGEAWQTGAIQQAASGFYDRIIILTDESATYSNFMDSLYTLTEENYTIDVIFNLHGADDGILFSDYYCFVDDLTDEIQRNNINIRTLYQTCCYGSYMIDDWESIGIQAVNGANALNGLAVFSPILFLRYWTNGLHFEDAVQAAYNSEIQELMEYNDILPIADLMLSEETLEESRQLLGGIRRNCFWLN